MYNTSKPIKLHLPGDHNLKCPLCNKLFSQEYFLLYCYKKDGEYTMGLDLICERQFEHVSRMPCFLNIMQDNVFKYGYDQFIDYFGGEVIFLTASQIMTYFNETRTLCDRHEAEEMKYLLEVI